MAGAERGASRGVRPAPGWAQHRMPIAGLYQTGPRPHPAARFPAGPGRNAAAVMLKDFGKSLDEVVTQGRTGAKVRPERSPKVRQSDNQLP